MSTGFQHQTPRMHLRPQDPAYFMLDTAPVTPQRVNRKGCYICEDREFARMGLPLCGLCCACAASNKVGHIPADDPECEDCGHDECEACRDVPAQLNICTCDTPCCQADVGVGVVDCGSQHCPTHGVQDDPVLYRLEGEN